jgi:hypothetical protein
MTKRKRGTDPPVLAKAPPPVPRPDFLVRLKRMYRGKTSKVTGAELISRERSGS